MNNVEIKNKLIRIERLLEERYGRPLLADREDREPLDELILTILSQNTTDKNSLKAFRLLKEEYPNWEKLSRANVERIGEIIKIGGLGPTKAGYILGLLKWLKENHGKYNLDFLCGMNKEDAIEKFTKIKGVGVKTISVTLAFACGMDIFPVDTHIFRVCSRLGLLPGISSREKAFFFLDHIVPEDSGFPLHMNIIRHGREVCGARKPACVSCFLNVECLYFSDLDSENEK